VSSVAWAGTILSSGGRDGVICCWDVRKRRDEACVARLTAHEQEVRAGAGRSVAHNPQPGGMTPTAHTQPPRGERPRCSSRARALGTKLACMAVDPCLPLRHDSACSVRLCME